jgi:hypothetical protein
MIFKNQVVRLALGTCCLASALFSVPQAQAIRLDGLQGSGFIEREIIPAGPSEFEAVPKFSTGTPAVPGAEGSLVPLALLTPSASVVGGTRKLFASGSEVPQPLRAEYTESGLRVAVTSGSGNVALLIDGETSLAKFNPVGLRGLNPFQDGASGLTLNFGDIKGFFRVSVILYDAADPTGSRYSTATVFLGSSDSNKIKLIPFSAFSFIDSKDSLSASSDRTPFNKNLQATGIGAVALFFFEDEGSFSLELKEIGTDGTCNAVPNSAGKVFDDCGVCNGGNRDRDSCGVCFGGNRDLDKCGICGGNNKLVDECGICGGLNKSKDACGVCGGNGKSCVDCANTPFGKATIDRCGVCGGDGMSCLACASTALTPLSLATAAALEAQQQHVEKVRPRRRAQAQRVLDNARAQLALLPEQNLSCVDILLCSSSRFGEPFLGEIERLSHRLQVMARGRSSAANREARFRFQATKEQLGRYPLFTSSCR